MDVSAPGATAGTPQIVAWGQHQHSGQMLAEAAAEVPEVARDEVGAAGQDGAGTNRPVLIGQVHALERGFRERTDRNDFDIFEELPEPVPRLSPLPIAADLLHGVPRRDECHSFPWPECTGARVLDVARGEQHVRIDGEPIHGCYGLWATIPDRVRIRSDPDPGLAPAGQSIQNGRTRGKAAQFDARHNTRAAHARAVTLVTAPRTPLSPRSRPGQRPASARSALPRPGRRGHALTPSSDAGPTDRPNSRSPAPHAGSAPPHDPDPSPRAPPDGPAPSRSSPSAHGSPPDHPRSSDTP